MEARTKDAAAARKRLHHLVDRLPEGELHAAERFLEFVHEQSDPFLRALANAPDDDEALTTKEREALEEGRRALTKGEVVSDEELRAELGL